MMDQPIEKAVEWYEVAFAAGPIKDDVEYAFSEVLPQLFKLVQKQEREIEMLKAEKEEWKPRRYLPLL